MNTPLIITGATGFIGMHVTLALLARGHAVLGIDNLNSYYDPRLKRDRLARLQKHPAFRFEQLDIADRQAFPALLAREQPERIVHLAAQAGVRYSITHPHAYVDANLAGFVNVLEAARALREAGRFAHLVYASSSSVYGANTKTPFAVGDRVDQPVSLYAASKRANELMADVYARQFDVPATGLRFFTVYGPWGRPDMAAYRFTRALLAGEPIDVYNHGQLSRDFTEIDDIVAGVLAVLERAPTQGDSRSAVAHKAIPHALYNLGGHHSEALMHFIDVLASTLGCEPKMNLLPMQAGDVHSTYADIEPMRQDFGWQPQTRIATGLPRFVAWYRNYHQV